MAEETRRFKGPSGAVFVPNVPDDTIALKVQAGEWTPLEVAESAEPVEPKGNASREEWAAWATQIGVEYPDDAKRDDIKALVAEATADAE